MLHIQGADIRVRGLRDDPVHAVIWRSREALPGIAAGAPTPRTCVVGATGGRPVMQNRIAVSRRQVARTAAAMRGHAVGGRPWRPNARGTICTFVC